MAAIDVVELARELLRCPSITPEAAGSFELLEERLKPLGFDTHRLTFSEPGTAPVENLHARIGDRPPVLAFCGHVDVVPPGDPGRWRHPPFAAAIEDGVLYGRGACDMKGAIAAFLAATGDFLARHGRNRGSIVLLLTADEEGPAVNGTRKLLAWLEERGDRLDAALVGEPTCEARLGDTIKIGRRGSLTGFLRVQGRGGHVAYPRRADNAAHRLLRLLAPLLERPLDAGTEYFEPSSLQIVRIHADAGATNVVPAEAEAVFNVRFNDLHTPGGLRRLLRQRLERGDGEFLLDTSCQAEPFLTPPGPLSDKLADAIRTVLGRSPELSTGGGTSDARFLRNHCPVVEFGLVNATIHQIDERVPLSDLHALREVYLAFLERFFEAR